MAIEGDKMFSIFKYLLIGILIFDFLCIHFSFLSEGEVQKIERPNF